MRDTDVDSDDDPIDMKTATAEARTGARAVTALYRTAGDDWAKWSAAIVGWRALRGLAFAKAHTTNIAAYAYRQAMAGLLARKEYAAYELIDKPTRSFMYKLCDSIEEIDAWYAALPASDKLRWRHPQAIVKHAPQRLLAGGLKGHNKPKPAGKKKKFVDAEIERLKALLLKVIKRLIKHEPEARDLLDQVNPPDDPNDSLDDISSAEDLDISNTKL